MRLVLLGPPGAGKGSLAKCITKSVDIFHISTGDILREEIKTESELGKEAKSYIDQGNLIPDEVMTRVLKNTLETDARAEKGFLLDGFPRTVHQAEDLEEILADLGKPLDFAVNMETTHDLIIWRLTGRRVCRKCGAIYHIENNPPKNEGVCDSCGGELFQRADDNEETIKHRLEVYLETTEPIIDFYKSKNKLKNIDGDADTPGLRDIVLSHFNELEQSN